MRFCMLMAIFFQCFDDGWIAKSLGKTNTGTGTIPHLRFNIGGREMRNGAGTHLCFSCSLFSLSPCLIPYLPNLPTSLLGQHLAWMEATAATPMVVVEDDKETFTCSEVQMPHKKQQQIHRKYKEY